MTPCTISLEMVPRTLKMHSMLGSRLSGVCLQMSVWLFGQFYQELQGRAVCLQCLEGVCRCPIRWWASLSFIQQTKHRSVECYMSGTMAPSIHRVPHPLGAHTPTGRQTVFSEHVAMKLGSAVEWRWEELRQGTVKGDLAGGEGVIREKTCLRRQS